MLNESIENIISVLQTERNMQNVQHSKEIKIDNLIMEEEKIKLVSDNENSNTESEEDEQMWRLLKSNVKEGTFFATPPTYNVFQLDKKHWLETNPISWKILAKSNSKCMKWLNEQCS